MFGIGMGEFILILIVGLIIFGPKNLPEVGKALGKGLKEFRKAQAALSATLEESVNETPKKTENKSAKIPFEEKTESVKISTDKIFNSADKNTIPKEIYTGTAETSKVEIAEKISTDENSKTDNAEKIEPARISVDDLINTVKENPISNTPAEEKISKEKTA